MIKKHKLIDKLKSWSITLGIATLCGGLAFAVDGVKKYTKTSAYDQNDTYNYIYFSGTYNENNKSYDLIRLFDFIQYVYTFSSDETDISTNFDYVISDDSYVPNQDFDTYSLETLYFEDIGSTFVSFSDEYGNMFFLYRGWVANQSQEIDDYINFLFNYNWSYDVYNVNHTILYQTFGYQTLRNYLISYNVPQSDGNFLSALTDFMQLLGGAIVQLAQPIANGVTEFARDLFIDNNHLSILGGVIGIFAGIALAVGITTKVYTWVSSLGN